MLLKVLIIISVVGISWAFAFCDEILTFITKLSNSIRIFIYHNRTFLDIGFLLLYSLIQLTFILQMSKNNANASLIISIFVLSLLTVMSIERLCLKSRFSFLDTQMSHLRLAYSLNEADYQRALRREEELIDRFKNLKCEYDKTKNKRG